MPAAAVPSPAQKLSAARGAALYIGAPAGPGLLLLPGLAAGHAGPAAVLAWLALLAASGLLAIVFAALGRACPCAGGVAGYTAAGLGARAGAAAGWCFLADVICGAPIVCLIGASYIAELTGGGHPLRCAAAAVLLLAVLGLALGGVRSTASAQLALVALLITVAVLAVAESTPSARAANWTPFAPHGWAAIGHAASTLMLSFAGWEAAAPLTVRFAAPSRQLSRVIAIAFAATTAVNLGCTVSATRTLTGRARLAALPALATVVAVLLFCGWTLAITAAVAITAALTTRRRGFGGEMKAESSAGKEGRLQAGEPVVEGRGQDVTAIQGDVRRPRAPSAAERST